MENIALQSQLSQLAKTLRIAHDAGSLDCHYEQKIAQLEQEKRDLLKISGLMSMKERQINEGSSAAVFLSIACFTTTWGIFDKLGITLNDVSWPLLLLTVNIACLENVFLLTNAVLDAGCDMIVKEKISRGLYTYI